MADLTDPPPVRVNRRRRLFLALLLLLLGWLAWEAVTWPDVADLDHRHPKTTAFIEHYRGWGLFGPKKKVEWSWVPYDRISSSLKRAVLVNEDMRFFSHNGFDEAEIKASLQDAWREKSIPRGASTITQQVAKNLWLSGSYNPLRKVKEAILTHQLETNLSKRRILELYLNIAEFGEGIYGAEAAARHYFHKSAASLSEREGAALSASLPRPKSWHPGVTSRGYLREVRHTQRRMAVARWLWQEI
ncbi:MAG TPA: monofunctional biosynthetic peptidoglycan transglycosylase [Thermoanaerobaculia bacterium]|jgi:monofunctional biosynthetic peptidoglycan transglycosylase|nr:monofunctional biosynthetic peptidoglycan transglycosylase [Thermoanaerobaculia bacterium]